jgi:hypothetical protein
MRITPLSVPKSKRLALATEVQRATEVGPLPDPVCRPNCPDVNLTHRCHRDCANASRQLSSEGGAYPLEPGITPLVFELKKLGVFEPCWSCEGHRGSNGELWKIPRVWFFSDSVVHVRALAVAVGHLFDTGSLSARWHIILTHSDLNNPQTTFSLEPVQGQGELDLEKLQSDTLHIARALEPGFTLACEKLIANAK